jgi:hypothetical protein
MIPAATSSSIAALDFSYVFFASSNSLSGTGEPLAVTMGLDALEQGALEPRPE